MPWPPPPPHPRLLTEPGDRERILYQQWLGRHHLALLAAWEAAEALSRAYDRAAVVTRDDNPEIPYFQQIEIDVLYSRWEALRWAGQKRNARS